MYLAYIYVSSMYLHMLASNYAARVRGALEQYKGLPNHLIAGRQRKLKKDGFMNIKAVTAHILILNCCRLQCFVFLESRGRGSFTTVDEANKENMKLFISHIYLIFFI